MTLSLYVYMYVYLDTYTYMLAQAIHLFCNTFQGQSVNPNNDAYEDLVTWRFPVGGGGKSNVPCCTWRCPG